MKKTYLILLAGLISGLTISRVSAQDEVTAEPVNDAATCGGIGIGIIPILPEDGEVIGEEATSGEGVEVEAGEVTVEEVVEVKDGEVDCPEIYYMSAGGPLPEERGEVTAAATEASADRDEAEEAPAPKFAKKSITDLVKKSSKPSAVKQKGRVFLRR